MVILCKKKRTLYGGPIRTTCNVKTYSCGTWVQGKTCWVWRQMAPAVSLINFTHIHVYDKGSYRCVKVIANQARINGTKILISSNFFTPNPILISTKSWCFISCKFFLDDSKIIFALCSLHSLNFILHSQFNKSWLTHCLHKISKPYKYFLCCLL